ncbi:MAG: primosomal protein N' [Deltaproteobacteria bacterium]|jgi:primosomal protein N' (replication factor Y)|nr:primosomal protein N' [Deltaproteobacteria bacterium]
MNAPGKTGHPGKETLHSPEERETRLEATVAVESAAPGCFSYGAPKAMGLKVGQMVLVPFGGRKLPGYVMKLGPLRGRYPFALKEVSEILRPEPLFGEDFLELAEHASNHYFYPIGLAVREILPGGLAPKLERVLRLTPAGLAAAEAAAGDSGESAAPWDEDGEPLPPDPFELLKNARPEPLPEAIFKSDGEKKKILELLARKLIERDCVVLGKAFGFASETILCPNPEPPVKTPFLGKVEKEFWERLKGAPPTPLSHFRNFYKDASRIAKNLGKKGLVLFDKREIHRDDPTRAIDTPRAPVEKLTREQEKALELILPSIGTGRNAGFLLFGVTGSGKTEVYLRACEKALSLGKSVLWLAPEIALTMGLESRIKKVLRDAKMAVLHSRLSAGERHDHWHRLARGEAKIALGARSAVFAPMVNLGLVVVDEEHDQAYKQDDGLRYNGRDLAAKRAELSGSVLILGSATPSLESHRATETGETTLITMFERPLGATLPEVRILDQKNTPKHLRTLSPELRKALAEAFARGEQALLFVNRRGRHNLPLCLSCGTALKCPNCSLNLTLHGKETSIPSPALGETGEIAAVPKGSTLVCHGCGHRANPVFKCPTCGAGIVKYLGVGTEKLLELVEKRFGVGGLRLDADSTAGKGGFKGILESFGKGEKSFLVGTQMAAKGHDFPNLTVVGVVDADVGLNLPDFRASERTFQLLSQVSGRAGRAGKKGVVFIQTLNPGHHALTSARDHDFFGFVEKEKVFRKELGLPPYGFLALLRIQGPDGDAAERAAEAAAEALLPLVRKHPEGEATLLGPAPAPVSKLRERHRHQIMLRASTPETRGAILGAFLAVFTKTLPKDVVLVADVDPHNLL